MFADSRQLSYLSVHCTVHNVDVASQTNLDGNDKIAKHSDTRRGRLLKHKVIEDRRGCVYPVSSPRYAADDDAKNEIPSYISARITCAYEKLEYQLQELVQSVTSSFDKFILPYKFGMYLNFSLMKPTRRTIRKLQHAQANIVAKHTDTRVSGISDSESTARVVMQPLQKNRGLSTQYRQGCRVLKYSDSL